MLIINLLPYLFCTEFDEDSQFCPQMSVWWLRWAICPAKSALNAGPVARGAQICKGAGDVVNL